MLAVIYLNEYIKSKNNTQSTRRHILRYAANHQQTTFYVNINKWVV